MRTAADALLDVVDEGVDFDGLTVSGEQQFRFETPATSREELTRDELRAVATESSAVTNWYFWHEAAPQRVPQWAFLRWLEGLDPAGSDDDCSIETHHQTLETGRHRTWGQLRVGVRTDGTGQRYYTCRHGADEATPGSELRTIESPRTLRDRIRFDDEGRYRPLRGAPTLPTGWIARDLDPGTLCEMIGEVYPASIENWHRERRGALDVTHWRETVARQTGMYGVIETWDRGKGHDHVERVARTCCDDSQCLKRRVWEYDEETPLDADPGNGEFPCREPCSLVISAARRWTQLDGEQETTYELRMTESEREQLERIVEAVADGAVDDIGEGAFEDGANRWRARYLREKRFTDDGRLPMAAVDEDITEDT